MARKFKPTKNLRSKDTLTAGTAWIKFGFKVLLLHSVANGSCTCGKKKCGSPGKHPISELTPNGEKNATDDPKTLKKWLTKFPNANIGGVIPQGLVIVDIDGPEGEESLKQMGALPKTMTNRTGRGRHLFYLGSARTRIKSLPGIDIKGNGYIVLPPSIHANRNSYERENRVSRIAYLPETFSNKDERKSAVSETKNVLNIQEGERDNHLFQIARQLRNIVNEEETVASLLRVVNERHCSPPLSHREVRKCALSASGYPTLREEYFGSMADVEEKQVEWLWYPYIPKHAVTLMAGDPGGGKSFVTMNLTSIITNMRNWPSSDERPDGNRVIVMNSEDDYERAIVPRLKVAGADLNNVRYMKKFRKLDDTCLSLIETEVENFKPELLIIDTITSYMGGSTDMYKQTEVQDFLVKLTDIAIHHGLAILVVAHLNKKSGESALHRVNGSIGFVAGVRSVLIVGRDPNGEDRRALALAKSNWGPPGSTLHFEMCGSGRYVTPSIQWHGESDLTADDICQPTSKPAHRPAQEGPKAEQFLIRYLIDNGPATWEIICKTGEELGHAEKTLRKVRDALKKDKAVRKKQAGRSVFWHISDELKDE